MRRLMIVSVLLGMMLVVVTVTGCGAASSASDNPLLGDWVDVAGGSIRFTEDVYYSNAADPSKAHFRYEVLSDTQMRLTPLKVVNGIDVADEDKARIEEYSLGEDRITMDSLWDSYYRGNSAAFNAALAEHNEQVGAEGNNAEANADLRACQTVRSLYVSTFVRWFDREYPDRKSLGYTIGEYIRRREIDLDWGFSKLEKTLGTAYAATAVSFAGSSAAQYADMPGFMDKVAAGVCPSGGEYRTEWDLDLPFVPQIDCDIHGGTR